MTAQFLGQPPVEDCDGFNAFGQPVPTNRRLLADQHLIDMGVEDTNVRFATIQKMSDHIERDNPYGAMEAGMRAIDLTGTYRLMAVLCTEVAEE